MLVFLPIAKGVSRSEETLYQWIGFVPGTFDPQSNAIPIPGHKTL